MASESTSHSGSPFVLFWLAWLVFWVIASLVTVGYLHRDNNYGVRPGDYSLRTIDTNQLAKLTPDQQARWDHIPGSGEYVQITIKSPFVFSHVLTQLLPLLLFSIAALVSYAAAG